MAQTIVGKKCPECGSFIKDDACRCSVCGYELITRKQHETDKTEHDGKKSFCPHCQIMYEGETSICKICQRPLKQGHKSVKSAKSSKGESTAIMPERKSVKTAIKFDWIKMSPGYTMVSRIDLDENEPFFAGLSRWEGFGFFLYHRNKRQEILIRKIEPGNSMRLFFKCQRTSIIEPGSELYVGALGIRLVGGLVRRSEESTLTRKKDGTVYIGPGEYNKKSDSSAKAGSPSETAKIQVLYQGVETPAPEVKERMLLGRSFFTQQAGLAADAVKDLGISQEHLFVTPEHGQWLVEPIADKPIYIEISERPTIVREGDILRWVFEECFGEFKIRVITET